MDSNPHPNRFADGAPVTWHGTGQQNFEKFTGTVTKDTGGVQVPVKRSDGKYHTIRRNRLSPLNP